MLLWWANVMHGVMCSSQFAKMLPVVAIGFIILTNFIYQTSCGHATDNKINLHRHLSLDMAALGAESLNSNCKRLEKSDVILYWYNRRNPASAKILNMDNPVRLDPYRKLIFLIHGWISRSTAYGFPDLKNAYLKKYDCNVVVVDWSKIAWQAYPCTVELLPRVAEVFAAFLCLLHKRFQISISTVHLVGHSLGGQMSGFIGQYAMAKCNQKVGRVTAMDPAGPLYQGMPESKRLDKLDAIFVDVIHSNQGMLGYWGDCGDADFYVNCGSVQPGCPYNYINISGIMDHPIETMSCDHERSVEYMVESINFPTFKAKRCSDCPMRCQPDEHPTENIMGEDCRRNATGAFTLETNGKSPFGLN